MNKPQVAVSSGLPQIGPLLLEQLLSTLGTGCRVSMGVFGAFEIKGS